MIPHMWVPIPCILSHDSRHASAYYLHSEPWFSTCECLFPSFWAMIPHMSVPITLHSESWFPTCQCLFPYILWYDSPHVECLLLCILSHDSQHVSAYYPAFWVMIPHMWVPITMHSEPWFPTCECLFPYILWYDSPHVYPVPYLVSWYPTCICLFSYNPLHDSHMCMCQFPYNMCNDSSYVCLFSYSLCIYYHTLFPASPHMYAILLYILCYDCSHVLLDSPHISAIISHTFMCPLVYILIRVLIPNWLPCIQCLTTWCCSLLKWQCLPHLPANWQLCHTFKTNDSVCHTSKPNYRGVTPLRQMTVFVKPPSQTTGVTHH